MSKKYFFIFSLGPVQSFIAQARKAQDLYLGCQMLSDYCRHAAIAFEKQGGSIIFPEWRSNSLTNRFMGIVELADEAAGKTIGEGVENTVKNRFKEEGLMAIQVGLGGFGIGQLPDGMCDQLNNHLETYWAFSPYDENDYAGSYSRAEQVFGMSKYLRTPSQLVYQSKLSGYSMFDANFPGETGRKCVVDGERNVKIYRWSQGDRESKHTDTLDRLLKNKLFLKNRSEVLLIGSERDKNSNSSVPLKFIQDGEGLSAVSFFKRCYVPDEKEWINIGANELEEDFWKSKYNGYQGIEFPSTAQIALKDIFQKAEENTPELSAMKAAYQKLKEQLKNVPDDEFFFEENLVRKNFDAYDIDEKRSKEIIEAQRKFKNALPKKNGVEIALHPYYALVSLDIDGLGNHLRNLNNKKGHESLAEKLHKFANKVNDIVEIESRLGCVLHAGGDDFLLMLNMQDLFKVLQEIEKAWSSTDNLTYSTAIVIAHYKSPLTRAVKTVKTELKSAKDRFEGEGKNGVACCFMAKSGAVTTSYFKQDKLSLLEELFKALQAGKYSPKLIFQFAKNMEEMGFDGKVEPGQQESIRKFSLWELQRLFDRAKDSTKVNKKEVILFAKKFEPLLKEQLREGDTQLDLQNFLQFLKMAELAAKHTNKWPQNEDTSK